jgi:hypothetical protein
VAQLFKPSSNTIAKASIVGVILAVGALFGLMYAFTVSSWFTDVGVHREQPVPFSHQHHVRGLGIDCRYCHTGVEDSPTAGIPATKTCMTCHSQIWTNAELLAPVREAYKSGKPIEWNRVHHLPQYVYFNHSIHIAKGVACTTCHGPVDRMPLMYQQNTLYMSWCIQCHRHPEKYIGPKEAVFKTNWTHPNDIDFTSDMRFKDIEASGNPQMAKNTTEMGQELVRQNHILRREKMTDCYTCHR